MAMLYAFCSPAKECESVHTNLGGGFKYFLFSPLFGKMIQFDEHIFQMGWFNHLYLAILEGSCVLLAVIWGASRIRILAKWIFVLPVIFVLFQTVVCLSSNMSSEEDIMVILDVCLRGSLR